MSIPLLLQVCAALIAAFLFSAYTVIGTESKWTSLMLLDTVSLAAFFLSLLPDCNKNKIRQDTHRGVGMHQYYRQFDLYRQCILLPGFSRLGAC